jgi:hypothetical protein
MNPKLEELVKRWAEILFRESPIQKALKQRYPEDETDQEWSFEGNYKKKEEP